ncbi:ammonium transporter [Candidatus Nitrospira bockiana]
MSPSDHTAWLLISTTLLMLTLPGVALFYGGMVRKKNVVNTMGLPLLALALVSIGWVMVDGVAVTGEPSAAGTVRSADRPLEQFSDVIAGALALALVAGALVERMRVSFFLLFGSLWVTVVYAPVAHWVWGGGWLENLGVLDFAGGAVIHLTAGVTALVGVLLIGPRRGFGRTEMMPNSLPLSVCGAGFLWVGWFGFSAGARVTSMAASTIAVVAIQASACAAALSWTVAEWLQRDKPTALGTVSGAVAGLVAIAPAAGYVGPLSALVIGIGAGGACYMAVNFVKPILGYDDSLDVFGMHAVGGTWGMVATGLFASTGVNPDGSDGLFFGYPYQFFAQCVAVLAVWSFAAGATFVIVKGLQLVLPARVDADAELLGLDLSQHGEKGYS